MRRVILESPFAAPADVRERAKQTGDWSAANAIEARNLRYLRALALWSLLRGDSPYASHRLFTQWLSDTDPVQRQLGIDAGLAWAPAAEAAIVGTDLGISTGMRYGIERHRRDSRPIEFVELGPFWDEWQESYPDFTTSIEPRVTFHDYVLVPGDVP